MGARKQRRWCTIGHRRRRRRSGEEGGGGRSLDDDSIWPARDGADRECHVQRAGRTDRRVGLVIFGDVALTWQHCTDSAF
ncbi:hypothetical protein Syun_012406 [Stephania yunnanensis]|uniref:Uncharacterized protein n=1 Tax=Stephania yunnanensis TaxID=152371 RepID=A0AAP0PJG0_9MAGN